MITVREAKNADIDTVTEFQIRMARETEDLSLDPDTVRKGVTAVLEDPTKGAYRVAELDGTVVGCLLTVPEWSDWRNGTVLWIHSLYVVSEARLKGVFRAMYSDLRDRVEQSSELMGMRLYVDQGNVSAQATYAALGMDGDHYRLFEWMKG